jgi:5'-3' exonuclease
LEQAGSRDRWLARLRARLGRVSTLLLLDAPSLWYRAYYGVKSSTTTTDGIRVNAVRGFLDTVARLVRDHRPTDLVACLDADWRPQWRVDLVPAYKLHRVSPVGDGEQAPDDLSPQVQAIDELLDALGIARLGLADCEADDVIATLATTFPGTVLIATGDRDLFQLVDDRVALLYSVEQLRRYGPDEVHERFGVPAAAYADLALLRGDSSDGLPGVKGIGEKTAVALLRRFGSVRTLVQACVAGPVEGVSEAVRARVVVGLPYLAAAAPVVAVRRDAPVPGGFVTALPHRPQVPPLAQRWNAEASVTRLVAAICGG